MKKSYVLFALIALAGMNVDSKDRDTNGESSFSEQRARSNAVSSNNPTHNQRFVTYASAMNKDVNITVVTAEGVKHDKVLTKGGKVTIAVPTTIKTLTIVDPQAKRWQVGKDVLDASKHNKTINGATVYVIDTNALNPTRAFRVLNPSDMEFRQLPGDLLKTITGY